MCDNCKQKRKMAMMSEVLGLLARKPGPLKVFDWDKAAKIIADNNPTMALAALAESGELTETLIVKDGIPLFNNHEHLGLLFTMWQTPSIAYGNADGGMQVEDCWKLAEDTIGYKPNEVWPESARKILTDSIAKKANATALNYG
jgi:hypothetical protein